MKIAIYRSRENGEILRVDEVPKEQEGWTEAAADYNSREYIDTVKIIKELTDLELYLYNRAEINISDHKEKIENMRRTLSKIEKSIDWLCDRDYKAELENTWWEVNEIEKSMVWLCNKVNGIN